MSDHSDNKHTSDIASILKQLMEGQGLRASELARAINTPETTIRYLIYGVTKKPTSETLSKLADYFGVTIEYLLGKESVKQDKKLTEPTANKSGKIPIIHLDDIKSWPFRGRRQPIHKPTEWVSCDESISSRAFAILESKGIRNVIPPNSVLIVDPNSECKDGNYVISSTDKKLPTIKRYLTEEQNNYLENPRTQAPPELIDSHIVIYGRIIEARIRL